MKKITRKTLSSIQLRLLELLHERLDAGEEYLPVTVGKNRDWQSTTLFALDSRELITTKPIGNHVHHVYPTEFGVETLQSLREEKITDTLAYVDIRTKNGTMRYYVEESAVRGIRSSLFGTGAIVKTEPV